MKTHYDSSIIEKQAHDMAEEAHLNNPDIEKVYDFSSDREVRLLEVSPWVPKSRQIDVFYFRPSPDYGMPLPSGVAMIRPEEDRLLPLPEGWGTWESARVILSNGRA